MPERFTIVKTRRWGNASIDIATIASLERRTHSTDDAIRFANECMSNEKVFTNEEIEYEVILSRENGEQDFIHRVDKSGPRSI
tara:strand:+ start:525 stop:773 length:249 start_codon:yes stop_codon:yes gene_type:complete